MNAKMNVNMNKTIGLILLVLTLVAATTTISVAKQEKGINVNGAGSITTIVKTGDTITSTFELSMRNDINNGIIRYYDGHLGIDVVSTDISKVEIYDIKYNAIKIEGTATIDGTGSYPFAIFVSDGGDPARNKDFFMIVLPSLPARDVSSEYVPAVPPWVIIHDPYEPDLLPPYTNYGYLERGNIRIIADV